MRYVSQLAAPLLLLSIACTSTEEPRHPGTLLVTNATCVPGPCVSVGVVAYPQNHPGVPVPWGIVLGTVAAPSACLSFPAADTFFVVSAATNDTSKTIWTPVIPVALGGLLPGANRFFSGPSTAEFLPTSATGWTVSLPGDTLAHTSGPCTP
jgi:hypothetical protein